MEAATKKEIAREVLSAQPRLPEPDENNRVKIGVFEYKDFDFLKYSIRVVECCNCTAIVEWSQQGGGSIALYAQLPEYP